MEVRFNDPSLEELEKRDVKTRLAPEIVRAYRKTMNFLRNMIDERDLVFPGLRAEKLKGTRSHQRSVRINDQWRLIFEIEKGNPGNIIRVISIEDYH